MVDFRLLVVAVVGMLVALPSPTQGAIWAAIQQDSGDLVRSEIAKNPSVLNQRGSGGQTPMMNSVLSGKTESLKALIELGADATIGEKDGYTPMHGAGFQGRADAVPLLVAYGLDPNDMHRDGFTPLHRACWGRENRHTETVKAFLKAGVDPQQPSRDGKRPIDMARNAATKAVLREAIQQGEL